MLDNFKDMELGDEMVSGVTGGAMSLRCGIQMKSTQMPESAYPGRVETSTNTSIRESVLRSRRRIRSCLISDSR